MDFVSGFYRCWRSVIPRNGNSSSYRRVYNKAEYNYPLLFVRAVRRVSGVICTVRQLMTHRLRPNYVYY